MKKLVMNLQVDKYFDSNESLSPFGMTFFSQLVLLFKMIIVTFKTLLNFITPTFVFKEKNYSSEGSR